MKYLTLLILILSLNVHAQSRAPEREGDLALPVTDLEIEKQEEALPPTIDQVEMKQHEDKQSDHHRVRGRRPHGSEEAEGKKY